jgi:hypothetical protein
MVYENNSPEPHNESPIGNLERKMVRLRIKDPKQPHFIYRIRDPFEQIRYDDYLLFFTKFLGNQDESL